MSQDKKASSLTSSSLPSDSAQSQAGTATLSPPAPSFDPNEMVINGQKIKVMPIFDESTRFLYSKIGQGIRTIDDRLEMVANPYDVPPQLKAVKTITQNGIEVPVIYMMLGSKTYQNHELCSLTEAVGKHRPEWANVPGLNWGADNFCHVGDCIVVAMDERIADQRRKRDLAEGQRRTMPMQQKVNGRPWEGDKAYTQEARDPFSKRDGVGINVREHRGPMPLAVEG